MSDTVVAAIISAVVALITVLISFGVAWWQLSRERLKWVADLKASYHSELYKTRLTAYPEILKVIGDLSTRAVEPLSAEKAEEVARKINTWLYGAGGLCASKQTRGALLGLREVCLSWRARNDWGNLYGFRNPAIEMLRRDLDIKGLESYDFNDLQSVLEELKEDMASPRK
jgi:hypothetical protein